MKQLDAYTVRVIFLDFDGVLNSHAWMLRRHESRRESKRGVMGLDPAAVGLLNQLIDRTGALVVISSTHRMRGVAPCKRMLKAVGFTGTVIGRTLTRHGLRGDQIQAWLKRHKAVTRFVILDDDSQDMAHLVDHLVQTGFHSGLTQAHVDAAVKHLRGDQP